jgi:hypothetical protein
MTRTLLTLLSEQTLPNVLFIKQFGKFDRYVFLTSPKMEREKRGEAVRETCGIKNSESINVPAENLVEIATQLRAENWSTDEEIIINLTGGTKMMALAVYDFFVGSPYQASLYYKPKDKDVIMEIYPNKSQIEMTTEVNLHEYLTAYGIRILDSNQVSDAREQVGVAQDLMQKIGRNEIPLVIKRATHQTYREKDKKFLMGEWLELWLADEIKKHFHLTDKQILYNVTLQRGAIDSQEKTEYDVMYVRNNRLYIAECKYFSGGNFTKSKINKEWYKLAGLQLHMGLYATPFLATANPFPLPVKEYLQESHKLFRIKDFADINILKSSRKLKLFLNNL